MRFHQILVKQGSQLTPAVPCNLPRARGSNQHLMQKITGPQLTGIAQVAELADNRRHSHPRIEVRGPSKARTTAKKMDVMKVDKHKKRLPKNFLAEKTATMFVPLQKQLFSFNSQRHLAPCTTTPIDALTT